MKRLSALGVIAISTLILGAVLIADDAVAQKSPQELLVGAWKFVSADSVRNDGSKVAVFGSNPKGILIFTGDGHFALVQMRADIPRLASTAAIKGLPRNTRPSFKGRSPTSVRTHLMEPRGSSTFNSREVRLRTSWEGASKKELSPPSRQMN